MKRPYHLLLLSVVFTTGLCSLGYQVVWQRYLSVLLGHHARSSAIIVSVFLFGLAMGYYAFGLLAEKINERKKLLKIYGFVELVTGFYAGIFPSIFKFLLDSSISQTNNFWIHLLLATILLVPATFLMGATIPIMTTVLPEKEDNVNLIHSRIYGLNTLGSFVGTLICGLYLITKLGNDMAILLLAFINIAASLFYIKNNLKGLVYEKEKPEVISHPFNQKLLYGLGFVAGMTCLSLEVLWFRILGLTIGNSFIVFPFVLSIFVLMIGLGPLTLKKITLTTFQNSLGYSLIFSFITFLTVPYLPLFISNLRVSFASHQLAFYLYHILIYLVFLLLLFPAVFYLGRLLPFIYSMIEKNNKDYGLKVGKLYFVNTLGTFCGSIFLGYLAFYFFDLKVIYLASLGFLCVLGFYFLKSRWIFLILIAVLMGSSIIDPFSRKHHELGLFRARIPGPMHFKNISFEINRPREKEEIIYFKDGPNSTVSILKSTEISRHHSKSIMVNGKSDGNTWADYPTTALVPLVPYIMTKGDNLKTMVIGIGTGISAGIFAKAERVTEVDVVEISSAVIGAAKHLTPENLDFHKNPKTVIHENDAFQYLKAVDKKYDIILSVPSNPWVMGVENLYTIYYYNLAKNRMVQDGIFAQWMHTYTTSPQIITTILSNLKSVFKNVTMFHANNGDIALFASNRNAVFKIDAVNVLSLKGIQQTIDSFEQEGNTQILPIENQTRKILDDLGIPKVSDLNFFILYNSREIDAIITTMPSFLHEIFYPKLNKESYFSFYEGKRVHTDSLLHPIYKRMLMDERVNPLRIKRLKNLLGKTDCKEERVYLHFPCAFLIKEYGLARAIKDIKSSSVRRKTIAYSKLRDKNLIDKDLSFIKKAMESLPPLKEKKSVLKISSLIFSELVKEQEYPLATYFIKNLESKKFMDKEQADKMLESMEQTRIKQQKLQEHLN